MSDQHPVGKTSSSEKLIVFDGPWEPPPPGQRVVTRKVYFLPEEGGYSVFVANLPGCASCGSTYEEALVNIREALAAVVQAHLDAGTTIPRTEDTTPIGALHCNITAVVTMPPNVSWD